MDFGKEDTHMVLEAILDPDTASGKPWAMFILGIVFVSIAVASAKFLLANSTSLLVVSLVALPSVTLISNIFNRAESASSGPKLMGTFVRYFPVMITLGSYFLGVMAAFTAYYVILPPADRAVFFTDQTAELSFISSTASGHAVATPFTGDLGLAFEFLFINNLKVLAIILLGSILYGAGSIFVLDWNASVLGTFLGSIAGQLARSEPAKYTLWSGLGVGLLGLVPHGTFELLAYLAAALAGGILSAALLRNKYNQPGFIVTIYDVAKLTSVALLFLAAGALIEGSGLAGIA
jgi:uncharacterized membrane protein SpoIIM required for sporulation